MVENSCSAADALNPTGAAPTATTRAPRSALNGTATRNRAASAGPTRAMAVVGGTVSMVIGPAAGFLDEQPATTARNTTIRPTSLAALVAVLRWHVQVHGAQTPPTVRWFPHRRASLVLLMEGTGFDIDLEELRPAWEPPQCSTS